MVEYTFLAMNLTGFVYITFRVRKLYKEVHKVHQTIDAKTEGVESNISLCRHILEAMMGKLTDCTYPKRTNQDMLLEESIIEKYFHRLREEFKDHFKKRTYKKIKPDLPVKFEMTGPEIRQPWKKCGGKKKNRAT